MKVLRSLLALLLVSAFAAGVAISAQDRYSLKVPNGLAFSEFEGYDRWEVMSLNNGGKLAVILGNPVMIKALKAGVPGKWRAIPRRSQDGKDPLERNEERYGTRSAVSAGCAPRC